MSEKPKFRFHVLGTVKFSARVDVDTWVEAATEAEALQIAADRAEIDADIEYDDDYLRATVAAEQAAAFERASGWRYYFGSSDTEAGVMAASGEHHVWLGTGSNMFRLPTVRARELFGELHDWYRRSAMPPTAVPDAVERQRASAVGPAGDDLPVHKLAARMMAELQPDEVLATPAMTGFALVWMKDGEAVGWCGAWREPAHRLASLGEVRAEAERLRAEATAS